MILCLLRTSSPSHVATSQFWPALASEGNPDNYLACGECFELVITYPNGSDYAPGDPGYTDPIYLETVDSCPCDANPKWCCMYPHTPFHMDRIRNFVALHTC